jgi:predicted  nucleic acid-binding Zn-ribbon protein
MDWLAYWPIVAFVVGTILLPALIWAIRIGLASKGDLAEETKARGEALDDLEGRLMDKLDRLAASQSALSDRTLKIETEIRHLPSAEDIAELATSAARTETEIKSLTRELSSMNSSLTRIENHLFGARA